MKLIVKQISMVRFSISDSRVADYNSVVTEVTIFVSRLASIGANIAEFSLRILRYIEMRVSNLKYTTSIFKVELFVSGRF
jgi:hypothetical protein